MLQGTDEPLYQLHDLVLLDLDGVVFHGSTAVPASAPTLSQVRGSDVPVAFITNNASRSPDEVAAHLQGLGVPASASEVLTSSQAAAGLLVSELGPGAKVAVLGAPGLARAVAEAGLTPLPVPQDPSAERPDALVTGLGPDVVWGDVLRAGVLIAAGVPWVAANADLTFPSDFGVAPGHGALVRMLSDFAGVVPRVAGKPEKALFEEAVRRHASQRPLMVGDRIDTDIVGAVRSGVPSLLVLGGVSGLGDIVAAGPGERPTYLGMDVGSLLEPAPLPATDGDWVRLGGWATRVGPSGWEISGHGAPVDWWRAVVTSAWIHLDTTGSVAPTQGLVPPSA